VIQNAPVDLDQGDHPPVSIRIDPGDFDLTPRDQVARELASPPAERLPHLRSVDAMETDLHRHAIA
jgi:hypothetical protein